MTLRNSSSHRPPRASDEDRVTRDPDAPHLDGPEAVRAFLDTFSDAAARRRAKQADKDRAWIAAYLRTFPDRVHSLEELTQLVLERRLPAVDQESSSELTRGEQRLRELAAQVWEEYEAGRLEAAPYPAEKRDARERAFIASHLEAKPDQTLEELTATAVRWLVTWNDQLSEGQQPIARERVTMIARAVWEEAHPRKPLKPEEWFTTVEPREASADSGISLESRIAAREARQREMARVQGEPTIEDALREPFVDGFRDTTMGEASGHRLVSHAAGCDDALRAGTEAPQWFRWRKRCVELVIASRRGEGV